MSEGGRMASIVADVSSSLMQLNVENIRLFTSIAATLKLVESAIGTPNEPKGEGLKEPEELSAALMAIWNFLIPYASSAPKKWDLPTTKKP